MWALIVDGVARQIEAADPAGRYHPGLQWAPCPADTAVGSTYAGGAFTAPAVPAAPAAAAAVPQQVTPAQLILGLAADGLITPDEAEAAAATGAMPAGLASVVATLPAPDQLAAKVRWARMTAAYRADPLLHAVAAAHGKTDADLDVMFVRWAAL